jgi:hypothetical protein
MSHTHNTERKKSGPCQPDAQVPFLSLPYIDDDECARTTKLTRPFPPIFFWSPFPTCSSHLWSRSFNSKIDVTACVLGLISPLNHVRCSRASNDRYTVYKRKKQFYTQPSVSTFCVVATFFFPLPLSTHDHFVTISESLSQCPCVPKLIYLSTHTLSVTLFLLCVSTTRRRRYSFLFLSSSSFLSKARERRRISPAIFLVSFIMSTRQKKKRVKKKIP